MLKKKTKNDLLTVEKLEVLTFLRAISIILVILSHNPFFEFKPGVVGVDIFFLISGYLITSQLQGKIKLKGLMKFYYKRARRILPSLIITLIITVYISSVLNSKEVFESVKAMAFTAIIFINNIYQLSITNNYFKDIFENSLNSLWSLSIEEQIYLFFPLFYLSLNRYKKKKLIIGQIILLISLIVATILHHGDKYYLLYPRFIEFILGSFIFEITKLLREANKKYNNFEKNKINKLIKGKIIKIDYKLYIILIFLLSILERGGIYNYPSFYVFLIIVMTSYFLITNVDDFKSNHFLNYLGERSYNIYLVYLPVLVLSDFKSKSNIFYLFTLIIMLMLAELLYKIDNFFRYKAVAPKKVLPLLFILLIVLGLVLNIKVDERKVIGNIKNIDQYEKTLDYSIKNGFKKQNSLYYQEILSEPQVFTDSKTGCDSFQVCYYPQDLSRKGSILVIADSSARATLLTLKEFTTKHNLNLIYFNETGCDPAGVPLDDYNITDGRTTEKCVKFFNTLVGEVEKIQKYGGIDLIYQEASSPKRTIDRKPVDINIRGQYIENLINKLKPLVNEVNFISEAPYNLPDGADWRENDNYALNCIVKSEYSNSCNFKLVNNHTFRQIEYNKKLAKKLGVNYIDLRDLVCKNGICPVVIDNLVVYRDELHISPYFIKGIKDIFISKLKFTT